MTVQNDKTKEVLLGDGTTTVFPYTFALLDKSHIKVYLTDLDGHTTMLESGYRVDTKNCNVIYPYPFGKPLPAGWKMTIMRVVPVTQEMDLINQGALPNETLEKAYDKLTMIAQQLNEESNRSLKADVTVIDTPYQLPAPAPGKAIGWNEDGTGMANYDNPGEASAKARAAADRAEEAADRAAAAADAVGDATHEATPNTLIRRDANGRAKVAAPVEADDIARKAEVDAHKAENVSQVGGVHGLEYEEGTWTPMLNGKVGSNNHAYTTQVGAFVRINKLVFIYFWLAGTKDTEMSGVSSIKGIPFAMNVNGRFGCSFAFVRGINYTKQLFANGFSDELQFIDGEATIPSSSISSTFDIRGSMFYEIP